MFTDLGLPLVEGLKISVLEPDGIWKGLGAVPGGVWARATEPRNPVAQAFMVESPQSFVWERTFCCSILQAHRWR